MDQCNKDLCKKPINWTDLEKQLPHLQARIGVASSVSGIPSHSISINKLLVKKCTDLLIKQIKKLNQAQVNDQLENLAQSFNLTIYKTPSEEDPNILKAYLATEDFYFEVTIALSGEIIDAKFSIFSEPLTSSNLLKDIFCSWNWDLLSKHIEGIKCNFILNDPEPQTRSTGFKAIQYLEKNLSQLYQFEIKFLENANGTKHNQFMPNKQSNYTDKLVNQTPIGVFKKSELGQPLRLYYYLSPLDLIQHHHNVNIKIKKKNDSAHNAINNFLSTDDLFTYKLGSYLSVSLVQSSKQHELIDKNLLILTDKDDERTIFEYLNPYINQNFNTERNPLFKSPQKQSTSSSSISATFQVQLNKPIVMCLSTLKNLHEKIGIESPPGTLKPTPFFELLAKTAINNKILNDAYSVQLPDENQVYYITELDETSCLGVTVEKISFTHPQDLILIIEILRKQLLFNELLLSCMRRLCTSALNMSNNNYNLTNFNYSNLSSPNVRILEIGLIAPFVVSVIMQHPKLMCYTTIEIDVSRGNVETRFRDHNDLHNPSVISEIIRRCHSIPVTIRALLMKYKQNTVLNTRRKPNNNNYPDDNGKNSRNKSSSNHFDTNQDLDQSDQHMTSENYHFSNIVSDEMQIAPSDSLEQLKSLKQEQSSRSLPNFSTELTQKFKKNEEKIDDETKTDLEEELEKTKQDNVKLKTPTDSSGMAKKRKASTSSASDSVPTTPVVSTNPPSAKRKMIQNQSSDIKRHNSMNEESRGLNGNSCKKKKLKPSLSSVDVSQKPEQPVKKSDSVQKAAQNVPRKDSNVLTSSNSIKSLKEAKSMNKTPSSTNQVSKKMTNNTTPGEHSSSNQTRVKSEDVLKAKVAKDKGQKSSTTPGKNLNISSTEIQLKQQQSPQVNMSANNLINSSSEKIRESQLNHRTPSPSASSLSSLSMSTSLISPSNDYINSDTDTNLKYEPALISRPKLKQIKESEMKKNSKNPETKPSTPPLLNNKSNIAQSLGLNIGTSLKGGFKIPHKAKPVNEDNNEDNLKNPLSSSSPIVKSQLGSPNKSSLSPQYDPAAPSVIKNAARLGLAANSRTNSFNKSGSLPVKPVQRPCAQVSRPPTPVPVAQLNKKAAPPVPLMSLNSTMSQGSDMTPSSPSPSPQEQQSVRKKSGTPQPPDSPISDNSTNSVKPKLIPLERNSSKISHPDKTNRAKQSEKIGRDDQDDDNCNPGLFVATFSTRNINNSNEVLSNLGQMIAPYVPSPAVRLTNSPGILDEDLANNALTS